MIITLVAWLYITVLCWSYGSILIRLFNKISGSSPKTFNFFITCFAGLSLIAILSSYLSLIVPIGTLPIQLFVTAPALLYLVYNRKQILSYFKLNPLSPSYLFTPSLLLWMLLAMILVLSVWVIEHPDTLGYHAPTIQWIEKYKAVPGLVHLNVRLGYQGLWFVVCAFFSFSFLHLNALTFINSTVLVWFVFFAISKICTSLKQETANKWEGFLYLLLLAISTWSFTQIRLTALSVSPDFIAALYAWMVFFLFTKKDISQTTILLLAFLCCTGISVKLAIAPLLLVVVYNAGIQFKAKQYRQIFFTLLICLLTLLPFLARNSITSGYLIFPYPKAMLSNLDWAYDQQSTTYEKEYIQAYARIPKDYANREDVLQVNNMHLPEWIPTWWYVKSLADKCLLLFSLFLIAASVLFLKKSNIYRITVRTAISIFVALAGLAFWFINAPDPRFGYGFLIPLDGILLNTLLQQYNIAFPPRKRILSLCTIAFAGVLLAYNIYRIHYFFTLKNIIYPYGIKTSPYSSFTCNGITFFIPDDKATFGNIPIPSTNDDSCKNFVPRSTKISDGFKKR